MATQEFCGRKRRGHSLLAFLFVALSSGPLTAGDGDIRPLGESYRLDFMVAFQFSASENDYQAVMGGMTLGSQLLYDLTDGACHSEKYG